jgi:hypothetical protein
VRACLLSGTLVVQPLIWISCATVSCGAHDGIVSNSYARGNHCVLFFGLIFCSALATPNNDIRRRTLDVAMDLVSPRNVEEVMALLKKEIVVAQAAAKADSASAADSEDGRYRTMLISAIHGCAVRFPEVANNVVHLLMDFLSGDGALPVIEFVREIVEVRGRAALRMCP